MLNRCTQVVFVVAAIASIATSKAATWVLNDNQPIESVTVDSSGASFAITGEASGSADGHDGGDITVTLTLEAATTNFATTPVKLVLASDDGDEARRQEEIVLVGPGTPVTLSLSVPTWLDCQADPCFDDLVLTISDIDANASLVVTGTVDASLIGRESTPDPDHGVGVEVTPL
ncbi:MAG: hypothetical protein H0V17_33820, partial [Deltaproteobacteria bacterium]|nr:hypothetical protein [Deltaproteobacteria bacterium]